MVGVIIVGHGDFATGLMGAVEMIAGLQEGVRALGLQAEEGPDDLSKKLVEAIGEIDDGDGVLVFADLFGGTPGNVSASLFRLQIQVDVITGVNMPMVLEALMARQKKSLNELADMCGSVGTEGIRRLSEVLSDAN